MPSGATVGSIFAGGLISGTANISNQLTNGSVNVIDALIATGTGAVTQGKGFWFTEVASITGAYVRAKLQDKDPLAPVAGAAIGNIVGSTGSKIITAGNQLKPIISNKTSNLTGAILGAGASEIACSEVQKQLEAREGKR